MIARSSDQNRDNGMILITERLSLIILNNELLVGISGLVGVSGLVVRVVRVSDS